MVSPGGGVPRGLEKLVNRLLPGYKISYRPVEIDTLEKEEGADGAAAGSLGWIEGSLSSIHEARRKNAATWTVPFRAQLASLVWGPEGLDKAKVANLVDKNNELIGQLADYAAKTEETQALIAAITQQQGLETGEDVGSAVTGFASQFPLRQNSTGPSPQMRN